MALRLWGAANGTATTLVIGPTNVASLNMCKNDVKVTTTPRNGASRGGVRTVRTVRTVLT